MDVVYVAVILTFLGTAFSMLLGWAEGKEPFDPRKLLSAILRGFIGGLAISLAYVEAHPTLAAIDVVVLLLAPMALDFSLNKGIKVLRNKT